jgi:P-type E1-E2 ATPase
VISIDIPGRGLLQIEHLVLDFNGTLALDGALLDGVAEALRTLSERVDIHVVTADTNGRASEALRGLPCALQVLVPGAEAEAKLRHVQQLGPQRTACIGNGRNDALMLREAALGIAVIGEEGLATEALLAAGIVARSIGSALGLLLEPVRLKATLRR